MTSLLYFKGFSVLRTSGLNETAEVLIHMGDKIDRNFMKGVLPWYLAPSTTSESLTESNINTAVSETEKAEAEPSYTGFVKKVKKENITPENMGEILLCQIPGISALYAQAILKSVGGYSNLLQKLKATGFSPKEFDNITYDCKGKPRRIPKTCGEEIARFFSTL
jgi:ERCC4-type nuclease